MYPFPRVCGLCDSRYFGESPGLSLCLRCFRETQHEFTTKGTLLGMEIIGSNSINHLSSLHLVTNKTGPDATVHVARGRNVLRAPETSIQALCSNQLKHVSGARPLVEPGSGSLFQTRKDGENKWCPACEKRLRKYMGGRRFHSFSISISAGYPMVLGSTAPKGEKDLAD